MKAHGNGAPEACAYNLLRTVRGEIPYDRVRGLSGALIDGPNGAIDTAADAEWVLETYEPRVKVEGISSDAEAAYSGDFSTLVKFKRKEEADK